MARRSRWGETPHAPRLGRSLAPVCLLALASCGGSRAARVLEVGMPEYPPPVEVSTARPVVHAAAEVPGSSVELEGTTWAGPDSDGTAWSFTFQAGGHLHYTLSGSEYDNATWKQEGSKVIMETNGHYADFTGTIRGRRITGSAHNRAQKSWTWVADRQP